jgi:hypothetical protein
VASLKARKKTAVEEKRGRDRCAALSFNDKLTTIATR